MNKFFIIVFLLISQSLFSQTWRWDEHDKWNSQNGMFLKSDKIEHALGSSFLYESLLLITKSKRESFVWSVTLGVLWEVKDAYFPYEKYGKYGGEGFSWKDVGANVTGIVFTMGVNEVVKLMFKKGK